MISPVALNDNPIDLLSRAAISREMGDRLRTSLPVDSDRLPGNMMVLIEGMPTDQPAASAMNRKAEVAQ